MKNQISVSLIAALANNRALGRAGRLLWHLPEDMRYFRETTRGKPVIMGRKTWESIPENFRPLAGRQNIVISRNAAYFQGEPPHDTQLATSLKKALRLAVNNMPKNAKTTQEVFVIGGAEIYEAAFPVAQKLYLTEIGATAEADAFFPEVKPEEWLETSRKAGKGLPEIAFDFVIYERRVPLAD